MKPQCWLIALAMFAAHAACAAPLHSHPILMTYWSDDTTKYPAYPLPGSADQAGAIQQNPALLRQLDAIDVLAYAFLQVDETGSVYFRNPAIDLRRNDLPRFCHQRPAHCPKGGSAGAGSFAAFARLNNQQHTLKRIISVGGAGSQRSLDEAVAHPDAFVQSAAALIRAYRLDGIDLDFEPDAFFGAHQGERITQIVSDLRKSLGNAAFISIEVPADWETLRSFDCPGDIRCRDNLALIAGQAYISLMGYEFHGPNYPGAVTGNNSNLYSDPDEPLLPGCYHVSDDQAIEYLTFRKVPAGRILLGFPGYFIAYGGVDAAPGSNGLYQTFDRSKTPAYDLGGLKGTGSYRAAQALLGSGFTPHTVLVNGRLSAVFAYDASARQWISYDNPASVAAKAQFAVSRHLAGMMMWEIGEDEPVSDPRSLLRSAQAALSHAPRHQ